MKQARNLPQSKALVNIYHASRLEPLVINFKIISEHERVFGMEMERVSGMFFSLLLCKAYMVSMCRLPSAKIGL